MSLGERRTVFARVALLLVCAAVLALAVVRRHLVLVEASAIASAQTTRDSLTALLEVERLEARLLVEISDRLELPGARQLLGVDGRTGDSVIVEIDSLDALVIVSSRCAECEYVVNALSDAYGSLSVAVVSALDGRSELQRFADQHGVPQQTLLYRGGELLRDAARWPTPLTLAFKTGRLTGVIVGGIGYSSSTSSMVSLRVSASDVR